MEGYTGNCVGFGIFIQQRKHKNPSRVHVVIRENRSWSITPRRTTQENCLQLTSPEAKYIQNPRQRCRKIKGNAYIKEKLEISPRRNIPDSPAHG